MEEEAAAAVQVDTGLLVSSMILTMVILGGAGSVPGALIGAVTIILYDKVFVPQLANWVALVWPVAVRWVALASALFLLSLVSWLSAQAPC